ncbi:TolC family protein [Pigmentiphaga litoralis]|uniref:TolC family protein n=1 Tax=Pigmentiphaga litoralis TaxID=516702 RepID=UPI00389A448E
MFTFVINALPRRQMRLHAQMLSAAISFSCVWAQAHAEPLTLDAALQAASQRSAAVQAAQISIRASSESAVSEGQLPDPMLKAGIDNLPTGGSQGFTIGQDFMTMRRVGIEQEWVSAEKRQLRSALAKEMVGQARSAYLAQVADIRQQTALAWLDAAYAKKALVMRSALVDHMSQELKATQASYRGAKASAADVVQAQAMFAQTQDLDLQAQQSYETALIGLSRWTGQTVVDVTGEPPPPESSVPTLSADELRRVQPTLAIAAEDVAVATADAAVATSERYPNWTWEVSYQQRGGAYSDMVSVGVRIPIPINREKRQDRTIAAKLMLTERARLMYEEAQRSVQADIRTQVALLDSGRRRSDELKRSLLPTTEQRVQLSISAYRAGTGTLADTFAARRAQLEAQLQVLDLNRAVSQTWARLQYQVVSPALALAQ